MKEFNYENIPNLLDMFSSVGKEIFLDRLNRTLKQYSKENQKKFFKLISDINGDYENETTIKYFDYLYCIANKPYTDFETILKYHQAICDANKYGLYDDLLEFFEQTDDINDVTSYISDYMLENNIYNADNLYNLIDTELKENGVKTPLKYLVEKVENTPYDYVQTNDLGTDLINGWWDKNAVFNEIYKDIETKTNQMFFDKLKVQERTLKM